MADPIRTTWVTFEPVMKAPDGTLTSPAASARYRMLIPMRQLEAKGFVSTIAVVDSEDASPPDGIMEADVVVFSKSFYQANERLAETARRAGMKIVFDISDNHFVQSAYAPHYRVMTALADLVVCNTAPMAECIEQHTGKTSVVIPDPFETEAQPPRFAPGDPLHLGWFGHPNNYKCLHNIIPALIALSREMPLKLTIVTLPLPPIRDWLNEWRSQDTAQLSIGFQPWSAEAQRQLFRQADIVVIPSRSHPHYLVKSPNRLIEAMRAGVMVVAHPLPSYLPFKDWAWIGEDLIGGIRDTLARRGQIPSRIAEAQRYIATHFSPETIGEQWCATLKRMLETETSKAS